MSTWEENWACAACYHLHVRDEERCENCGYPMGMDGVFVNSSTYATKFAEVSAQIGDWLCVNESCGLTHNSGSRLKCHKCGKGKYGSSAAARGRISSSTSSAAGGRVTSSATSAADSSSTTDGSTNNPYPYSPPGSPRSRPWYMTWMCGHCRNMNFGHKEKCDRCWRTGPNI